MGKCKRRPRGRPWSRSALARIVINLVKRLWTEQQMNSAIEAVKGGMKIFCAAHEYNVPRTTVNDQISGRVVHGTSPGLKPYLNNAEEIAL